MLEAHEWQFLLASLVCWSLAVWYGWVIVQGVRTGTLRNSRGQSICERALRPRLFWLEVAWHVAWVALILSVWWFQWCT